MALSPTTVEHLLEAQGCLRAALKSAAVNENPLVIHQISKLLMDIEHCENFEKLRDVIDDHSNSS
tara:strand:- start:393 stop:587 length:195 start_codon:yes stop_codon:yes gene_type:complete